MATAWTFQRPEQVTDLGKNNAPWYVGWYDPDGRRRKKSFGAGVKGKTLAERQRIKLEEELTAGTYQGRRRILWADFRKLYEERTLGGLAVRTGDSARNALNNFEKLIAPARVWAITTNHIEDFIAKRRQQRGLRKGDALSPASINHDLRHLKAALKDAVEWGYLPKLPRFRMEKAPRKLPRYVTGEHFAAIYQACDAAKMPCAIANIGAADWWRALLVMAYMSGWRIGDLLALRRDQVDLDAGTAVSLAGDNKGKRDELVDLHPSVVDHLRRIATFGDRMFPWPHDQRTLYVQFGRIQKAAGVNLPCIKAHEHTDACHRYGFHDLRRAFATMNADRLTADSLQALMRHKSYQTTQVYINMTRQMKEAVGKLYVPDVLKRDASGS
jgi:integrase